MKKIKKIITAISLSTMMLVLNGCFYVDNSVNHPTNSYNSNGTINKDYYYNQNGLEIVINEEIIDSTLEKESSKTSCWFVLVKDTSQSPRIKRCLSTDIKNIDDNNPNLNINDMATEKGAILAINGSYATTGNKNVISNKTAIHNGKLMDPTYFDTNIFGNTMTINSNGKLEFPAYNINANNDLNPDISNSCIQKINKNTLLQRGVTETLYTQSLPLIVNGTTIEIKDTMGRDYYDLQRPRTLISQTAEKSKDGYNEYLIMVCDGDGTPIYEGKEIPDNVSLSSKGLTIKQAQQALNDYAAKHNKRILNAMNLDGGGSSAIYFKNHILNHPSADDTLRNLGDIIYFN